MTYEYKWVPGPQARGLESLLDECANLYSNHYGIWGQGAQSVGNRVRLSSKRIRGWFKSDDSAIYTVHLGNELIGYAIAVRTKRPKLGIISWVTQLVVHEEHREKGIGKGLLFSIWTFSDHFSWGLLTSNPYAIRALEKATRRRCLPQRIKKNWKSLFNAGVKNVPYLKQDNQVIINQKASKIDTAFFVDHSKLSHKIARVTTQATPWLLGSIEDGWEWFAFTFNDQEQLELTGQEIEEMLKVSDQITRRAYSQVQLGSSHLWARHAEEETAFIKKYCELIDGQSVLDFGCGMGRHSYALAKMGLKVTGVDYIENFMEKAVSMGNKDVCFREGDCRNIDLQQKFDAVICLYDVIGTYVDNLENIKILENIVRHLKPNGYALMSVMNLELTKHNAKHFFSLKNSPNELLQLPASDTMEKTGNIFDPDFYIIDSDTDIVYRKEQFSAGGSLPSELIVRDRRFREEEITNMCKGVGLKIVWSRFVGAGKWEEPLSAEKAKEILILCQKS